MPEAELIFRRLRELLDGAMLNQNTRYTTAKNNDSMMCPSIVWCDGVISFWSPVARKAAARSSFFGWASTTSRDTRLKARHDKYQDIPRHATSRPTFELYQGEAIHTVLVLPLDFTYMRKKGFCENFLFNILERVPIFFVDGELDP